MLFTSPGPVLRARPALAALVSGALLGLATVHLVSWLAWFCLVPLFVCLRSRDRILLPALLAGLAYGLVMEFWVFGAVTSYTGSNWWVALACQGIAVAVMAVKLFLLVLLYGPLRRFPPRIRVVLWPLAATVAEYGLYLLCEGFPWFQYTVGFSQAGNLFFCQLAELGDVHLMTFVVLLVNLLVAAALERRSWKLLVLPAVLLLTVHGYGALRVHQVETKADGTRRVAVINDNSSPDLRWTRGRVDEYADRILTVAAEVEDRGQIINIWTEGVMPWAYRRNDDLTRAILETTPSETLHLIGMCSNDDGHFFNSAYVLKKDGAVVGRYDKQNLLKGLEFPAFALKLPFFEASPFEPARSDHRGVVNAGTARLGVVICNEGITSRVTETFAGTPCDFLVLIANDNWFPGTRLITHHFYSNRLRAIQCRRDLVINTNRGLSGLVSATGAILHMRESSEPFVEYYDLHTYGETSCPN